MAYLAIKRGIPSRPPRHRRVTDVKAGGREPEMGIVNGMNTSMASPRLPDYERRAEEEYRARSAVYWADQINVLSSSSTAGRQNGPGHPSSRMQKHFRKE